MQRHPMTAAGADALHSELAQLKRVERPRIIKAIAEAREHGDLKENAEYHAAREQQSFAEGRIKELESKLAHAQVIDVTQLPSNDTVIFGATVYLINLDNDKEVQYQIVGDDESDLKHHKISYTSPVARAMIGKSVNEVIEVNTPKGPAEYLINQVKYI